MLERFDTSQFILKLIRSPTSSLITASVCLKGLAYILTIVVPLKHTYKKAKPITIVRRSHLPRPAGMHQADTVSQCMDDGVGTQGPTKTFNH